MALSVAAVVVANPVIAPRADLEVPAVKVKLSGTGDALDMLNTDFLKAIGPAQTDSPSNPFAVLKDLVSSLAADATYLTKTAIVSAFFAGAAAVTNPELTAASFPYVPPSHTPPAAGGPVAWPTPVLPIAVPGPETTQQIVAAVAALPAEVVPAAAQIVMTLMDDVQSVSNGSAVSVAFAAGALLVTESGRALGIVTNLIDDSVNQALQTVLTVIKSDNPEGEIFNLLRSAVVPAPGVRSVVPVRAAQPPAGESPSAAEPPATGAGVPASPTPGTEAVGVERIQRRTVSTDDPVVLPAPAAGLNDSELPLPGILTTEEGHIDTGAVAPARTPVRSGPLRDALTDAGDQAQGALKKAVDAVKNATDTVRKAADHAAKAAAGPTGG